MTLESGLEIAESTIAAICERYGVRELAVFGSAARADWGPDSDIDLLVEFWPDRHPGLDYFSLEGELANVFGRRVELASKKWIKPQWRNRIIPEAKIIYAPR